MRFILRLLLLLIVLVVVAGAAIYFTGNTRTVIVWLTKPHHGWDPSLKAPPPDYADAQFWAAMPGKESNALFVPAGEPAAPQGPMVDVFFVHPTGYLHGEDWNSRMDPDSMTEENTKWMMANQASAFSGCCNVYAPRYREASIFRYLGAPDDIIKNSMDLAYDDVARAFDYFLAHHAGDRPFILASHSQGTAHAFRLLQEKIDGTPLADRLVAAYLIGGDVTNAKVDALKSVHACNSPTDTKCVSHWRTYGEGGTADPFPDGRLLCTNPLTWLRDGPKAEAAQHKGGVPISGQFSVKLWGADKAQGVEFKPLAAPVKNWTWAECRDGFLWVADQGKGPFDGVDMGGKNYHGLDYPLFALDIRQNASERIAAFLAAPKAPAP